MFIFIHRCGDTVQNIEHKPLFFENTTILPQAEWTKNTVILRLKVFLTCSCPFLVCKAKIFLFQPTFFTTQIFVFEHKIYVDGFKKLKKNGSKIMNYDHGQN